MSVGAINASDPGADTIALYSSRGPAGNGALKPDVTAIDGVNVTGAGGFFDPFFGTSAAAPHVAGLAALLLQYRPDLKAGESGDDPAADRAELRAAVLDAADDLGSAGPDNTYGHGRVSGDASPLFVAPVVSTTGDLSGVEGDVFSFNGLSFSDLNVTDTHSIQVDWDDETITGGAVNQTLHLASASHTYDDNGSFLAAASIIDDDGLSDTTTFTVTVTNAPPTLIAESDLTTTAFLFTIVLATFTDPGAGDTHTALIDWGDGTTSAGQVDEEAHTVSGSHQLILAGAHQITVTLTDDDGASDTTLVALNIFTPP